MIVAEAIKKDARLGVKGEKMKTNATLLATLALLFITCAGCDDRSSQSGAPATATNGEPAFVTPLLAEDWPAVVSAIHAEPAKEQAIPQRLVLAHALLALNQNNESVALLASIGPAEDRAAWHNWCESLARNHGQSAVAQYLLADSLVRVGRTADAMDAFERSLKLNPAFGLALDGKGVLLVQLGRRDEALPVLRQATKCAPHLADAFASLGSCQYECRMDGAIQSYREALSHSKQYALAKNGLACVLFCVGKGSAGAAGDSDTVSEAMQHLIGAGADPVARPLVALNLQAIVNLAGGGESEATTKPGTYANLDMDQLQQMHQKLTLRLNTINQLQTKLNAANNQFSWGPFTFGANLQGVNDQLAMDRAHVTGQMHQVDLSIQSHVANIPAPPGVSHYVPGGATAAQPNQTAISDGDWTLNVAYGLSFVPLPSGRVPSTSPILGSGL